MSVRQADVTALQKALAHSEPPRVVDVRTTMEFSGGHIANVENVPLTQIDGLNAKKGDEIWVICRSGGRSSSAAERLSSKGVKVVNVQGGMMAWTRAGHPVEGGGGVPWMKLALPVVASLTLGLAPFLPEPHLFGKVRWLLGGAAGMAPMDWFDLVLHGAPWLWLALTLIGIVRSKLAASS